MKMTDFVVKEAIVPDLQATTKESAIRALVESLSKCGSIRAEDEQSIVAAILKREELGSTGIGMRVAVPHTKHPSVDRLIATIALSQGGRRFRQPRRRRRQHPVSAGLSSRSSGRPSPRVGEHFASSAESELLQIPAPVQRARMQSGICCAKPTTTSSRPRPLVADRFTRACEGHARNHLRLRTGTFGQQADLRNTHGRRHPIAAAP